MFKKIISFIILTLFCISCESTILTDQIVYNLDVYSLAEQDNNGYYHYEYIGYNYGSIYFITEPYTLVYWDSDDVYCFWFWNDYVCEPVIDYQTYSREDGTGQQNFYINENSIGDTLTIVCYINSDSYDIIKLIIIDGR